MNKCNHFHNSSKIPWNALNDSLQLKFNNKSNKYKIKCTNEKPVKYFSYEFQKVLEDFGKTANSVIIFENDPTKWEYGDRLKGGYENLGYYDSLLSIYIMLNLILLDKDKYEKIWYINRYPTEGDDKRMNPIFLACYSDGYYKHPEHLIKMFKKLFYKKGDWRSQFKDLDESMIKRIKKYLNLVFQCLYNITRIYNSDEIIPDDNEWEPDAESIDDTIRGIFQLSFKPIEY